MKKRVIAFIVLIVLELLGISLGIGEEVNENKDIALIVSVSLIMLALTSAVGLFCQIKLLIREWKK